jgi:hypothetical protein
MLELINNNMMFYRNLQTIIQGGENTMKSRNILIALLVIGFLALAAGSANAFYVPPEKKFVESEGGIPDGLTPYSVSSENGRDRPSGENLYLYLDVGVKRDNQKNVWNLNDKRIYITGNNSEEDAIYKEGVEKGLFTAVGEVIPTEGVAGDEYNNHNFKHWNGYQVKSIGSLAGTVTDGYEGLVVVEII